MEYFPLGLKAAHIGVVGLGLYVAIEGQNKLDQSGERATNEYFTSSYLHGFSKDTYLFSTYIITVIALAQLAVLYSYHNYKGKEPYFRVAFYMLALVNLIFSAVLLQGSATLLQAKPQTDLLGGLEYYVVEGDAHRVAVAGAVLGALVVAFSFVNFYHASATGNRMEASLTKKLSPRRK